jgi:hypothetical protein
LNAFSPQKLIAPLPSPVTLPLGANWNGDVQAKGRVAPCQCSRRGTERQPELTTGLPKVNGWPSLRHRRGLDRSQGLSEERRGVGPEVNQLS